jgi:hypothetical protein
MNIRSTCFAIVALTASLTAVGQTAAAPLFHDDFEDGSAVDGNPVTWVSAPAPRDPATSTVTGGDYVLTPSLTPPYPQAAGAFEGVSLVRDLVLGDVIIRTQVRALGQGFVDAGIVVRDTFSGPGIQGANLYADIAAVDGGGNLNIGYTLNDTFVDLRGARVPWDIANTDVVLEFHVSGNTASLFAWAAGTSKPGDPQVSISPLPGIIPAGGGVGLFNYDTSDRTPLAFRYFEVEVIPEPSTLFLATIALCGAASAIVARRRHNRRARTTFCSC